MKTLKYISLRAFAIAALALVFAMPAKAQMTDNGYANIDWQFNFPLSNHFADKASGWGMNFEGGYFLTSNFALRMEPRRCIPAVCRRQTRRTICAVEVHFQRVRNQQRYMGLLRIPRNRLQRLSVGLRSGSALRGLL